MVGPNGLKGQTMIYHHREAKKWYPQINLIMIVRLETENQPRESTIARAFTTNSFITLLLAVRGDLRLPSSSVVNASSQSRALSITTPPYNFTRKLS